MASVLKKRIPRISDKSKRKFIDLNDLRMPELNESVKTTVKVAEIYKYEDLLQLSDFIYNGNIMLVDCSALSNDDATLKRVTEELKSMGRDIEGDVAALSKEFLILTPKGISIDRNKVRGFY
ncbi:MAG: cell division protein SepF [Candidatus Thermoplasmatota archaeon]|nr:cell division protein SepF [Candidatus Thermoplasmatota archaeon]MCL5437988.1 cell division protein SepF [Candidatus Thermoplasmatota archaeon]